MPIRVQCTNPECRKALDFPDEDAGKAVECPACRTALQVPAGQEPPPEAQMLGDFALVRKLGQGGMGAVYEAVQVKLDRKVALKVLPDKFISDPVFLERFQREAKAAAAINHPNIIQVYDIGEHEGTHFFAMELVDGESVQDRLDREGKLPVREAIDIVQQVAEGLRRAQEQSIIHRDIKPDNIMLTSRGEAKLADLGLAKSTEAESGLTQTGSAMGTVYYMAPEQAEDASRADHRSDIYALGITLLHMVTGKRPFSEGSAYNILFAHVQKPLPSAAELGTELPDAVETMIRKMCAKDPNERHQDYDALLSDLKKARKVARRKGKQTTDHRPQTTDQKPETEGEQANVQRSTSNAQRPTQKPEDGGEKTGKLREAPTIPQAQGRRVARLREKQKSKSPVLVVAGIAAVLLLGVGIFFALRSPRGTALPSRDPSPSDRGTALPSRDPSPPDRGTALPSRDSPSSGLPSFLSSAFEVPKGPKDAYGNPIRQGSDKETGMPLEIRHKQTGMHFVFIPPGEFLMGSPDEEKGRRSDGREGPVHKVRLTKPFYLGKYEVTQAEWRAAMGGNPSRFQHDRNPVEQVSWSDCQGFLKKLNESVGSAHFSESSEERAKARTTNLTFALPTEAQWEYACRAGTQTRFYFGDDPDYEQLVEYAWFGANSADKTHPVGEKKPNPWGLYDLSGNVWEWCQDRSGAYPGSEVQDPSGSTESERRVIRGSSWYDAGSGCRSAYRYGNTPDYRLNGRLGCRVALNLSGAAQVGTDDARQLLSMVQQAFEVPTATKDAYGNPIRQGSDEDTGLPLEIRHKQTGMHFVFIPPGEFLMGSPDDERDREADREGPVHRVRLTKPFYLGKYEVTQGEWTTVMRSNPSNFPGDKNPVELVSWDDCQEFLKTLQSDLGRAQDEQSAIRNPQSEVRCALPTEAQWEYACRAGTQTRFYFGKDPGDKELADYAWFNGNSGGKTHPVGAKKPNAWGLYDMSGNVWEWCEDWYGNYARELVSDPAGPERGSTWVHRGAGWYSAGTYCRSACRANGVPGHRAASVGCRAALNLGAWSNKREQPGDGRSKAGEAHQLLPVIQHAFEVPTGAKDAHGNPVRQGTDKETDLPLEVRHKQTGMHFVFIPPGEFLMGSPARERDRDPSREGPVHKVRLAKPFYLGKYEVTQAEWKAVMGDNPSHRQDDRNPVEQVLWEDCQEFLKKLNSQFPTPGSQSRFSLPTEAQWEYACRAGTQTRFYFGDDLDYKELGEYAWFKDNSGGKTHHVGEKKPNAWGLYDMSGNVWEWCQDWFGVYVQEAVSDPTGPTSGVHRAARGGGWHGAARQCRSANRNGSAPDFRRFNLGFRLALSPVQR